MSTNLHSRKRFRIYKSKRIISVARKRWSEIPLHNDPAGISLDDPISQVESGHISASVICSLLLGIRSTLLSEIWAEASAKADGENLQAVLNSPAPLDEEESRHEVSKPNLQDDEQPGKKAEDNPENYLRRRRWICSI